MTEVLRELESSDGETRCCLLGVGQVNKHRRHWAASEDSRCTHRATTQDACAPVHAQGQEHLLAKFPSFPFPSLLAPEDA